jgi:hypothetical protein
MAINGLFREKTADKSPINEKIYFSSFFEKNKTVTFAADFSKILFTDSTIYL